MNPKTCPAPSATLCAASIAPPWRPPCRPRAGTWPYASLVLVAVDHDLSPILLLSDLAEHTKAIAADDRVSLLFDGTEGLDQPLTGPRVTLVGRAARTDDDRLARRFLARHPDAEMYAGFKDFHFYRVAVERAHLVARLRQDPLARGRRAAAGAAAAGPGRERGGIVSHMNEDHADAVQLYAGKLLGLAGSDWRMTGIDAEGIDLGRPGRWPGWRSRRRWRRLRGPQGAGGAGRQGAARPDSAARHPLRGCEI